jgi:transposase
MSELDINDYRQILEYYNQKIPKSARLIKLNAEKILADKLCRCIKKIEFKQESRAIGICTKGIINNKGLIRGKFTCKGKRTINIRKMKKNNTKKNI